MRKAHLYLKKKSALYTDWHKHSAHTMMHLLIFTVVATLLYGQIFSVSMEIIRNQTAAAVSASGIFGTNSSSREEVVKGYNKRLLDLASQYEKADSLEKKQKINKDLRALIDIRKKEIIKTAKENPQAFYRLALTRDIRNKMPIDIQNLLEKDLNIEGELTVLIGDDIDGKRHEVAYDVKKSIDNKHYRVRIGSELENSRLKTGQKVKIKGISIDQEIVPEFGAGAGDASSLPTGVEIVGATTDVSAINAKKVLVILTNFTNDTRQTATKEQVAASMFGQTDSAAAYYATVSNGATTLTGNVVGWFTVPYPNTGCDQTSTLYSWAYAADAAAKAAGYDPALYDRVMYMLPDKAVSSYCSWGGWGTYGGKPGRTWIMGRVDYTLYTHEQGHNYGMNHAQTLDCGTSQISTSCTASEYGDNHDPMGNSWMKLYWNYFSSFNAPHMIEMGWLPTTAVQSVTTSGTYTVKALSGTDTTNKVIRISKPNTNEYYYISYRGPVGVDSGLAGRDITKGVSMHIWSGVSNMTSPSRTKQVPLTPGDGNRDNDVLVDGATFTDSANTIVVKQISHDSNSATLEITIGGVPAPVCTRNNHTVSINPISQSGSPGAKVDYVISIKNNDTSECSSSSFGIGAQVPVGWTKNLSVSSVSIAPGSTSNSTLSVTSPVGVADGTYSTTVTISDTAGNHAATSHSVSYVSYAPLVACTRSAPLVSMTPSSQSGAPSIARTYTASIKNNDSATCANSVFDIRASAPSGWQITPSITQILLLAGGTGNLTVTATPPSTLSSGTSTLELFVSDSTNTHATVSTSATYSYTSPTAVCVRNQPTFVFASSSQSGAPSIARTYTASIKNNDSSTCDSTIFKLSVTGISGWGISISPTSVTLTPGATSTGSYKVTPGSTIADGTYTIQTRLSDSSGNHSDSVAELKYTSIKPLDTVGPSVSLSAPNQITSNRASISSSAKDQSGIARIDLMVGTSLLKTCINVASCKVSWTVSDLASGYYVVSSTAVDRAGNTSKTSKSVYVE